MLRFLAPAAVFAVLLGFLYVGLNLHPGEIPSPFIGKPAPALSVPLLHDPAGVLNSAELAGKPWVLNVWGTWCVACREEHPLLMRLASEGVVTIHGLNYKDEPENASRWLNANGDPYTSTGADRDGRVAIDWVSMACRRPL